MSAIIDGLACLICIVLVFALAEVAQAEDFRVEMPPFEQAGGCGQ